MNRKIKKLIELILNDNHFEIKRLSKGLITIEYNYCYFNNFITYSLNLFPKTADSYCELTLDLNGTIYYVAPKSNRFFDENYNDIDQKIVIDAIKNSGVLNARETFKASMFGQPSLA